MNVLRSSYYWLTVQYNCLIRILDIRISLFKDILSGLGIFYKYILGEYMRTPNT